MEEIFQAVTQVKVEAIENQKAEMKSAFMRLLWKTCTREKLHVLQVRELLPVALVKAQVVKLMQDHISASAVMAEVKYTKDRLLSF